MADTTHPYMDSEVGFTKNEASHCSERSTPLMLHKSQCYIDQYKYTYNVSIFKIIVLYIHMYISRIYS